MLTWDSFSRKFKEYLKAMLEVDTIIWLIHNFYYEGSGGIAYTVFRTYMSEDDSINVLL